jgi:hypothetical protein
MNPFHNFFCNGTLFISRVYSELENGLINMEIGIKGSKGGLEYGHIEKDFRQRKNRNQKGI